MQLMPMADVPSEDDRVALSKGIASQTTSAGRKSWNRRLALMWIMKNGNGSSFKWNRAAPLCNWAANQIQVRLLAEYLTQHWKGGELPIHHLPKANASATNKTALKVKRKIKGFVHYGATGEDFKADTQREHSLVIPSGASMDDCMNYLPGFPVIVRDAEIHARSWYVARASPIDILACASSFARASLGRGWPHPRCCRNRPTLSAPLLPPQTVQFKVLLANLPVTCVACPVLS